MRCELSLLPCYQKCAHNVAILQPLNGEGHLKYANTDEIHVSIIQWRALFAMPMAAKEVGGVNLCVTQQETRIAPRMGVALKCKKYLDRTTVLL